MQTAVLLLCDISRSIENLRKDIDSYKKIPSHITLAYLKKDYNEDDVNSILGKIKRFDITLNDIACDKNHLALYANSRSSDNLDRIISKIDKYVEKKPGNGYHLSLAYPKEKWDVYESEEICTQVNKKIDLPIDVRIKEIWLIKKDKTKKGEWFKISSIKLKSDRPTPEPAKSTPSRSAPIKSAPKKTPSRSKAPSSKKPCPAASKKKASSIKCPK